MNFKNIIVLILLLFGVSIPLNLIPPEPSPELSQDNLTLTTLINDVLPVAGVELPISWDDLGAQLISYGVIDQTKLEEIYLSRKDSPDNDFDLLTNLNHKKLTITSKNVNFLLNLFWALGLSNQNPILALGPMADRGELGDYASTGGWTIGRGDALDHYNEHPLVILNVDQQQMLKEISLNIFRPCCNNSTYFPDCNHGMAMLGFLELMISQGISEQQIYQYALTANSFWFGQNYLTIAKYWSLRGVSWSEANAQLVLNENFSSATGFGRIANLVPSVEFPSESEC